MRARPAAAGAQPVELGPAAPPAGAAAPGRWGALRLAPPLTTSEADLDRGGRSVLEIRPLLWKDGWPVAGDDFKGGTFEIESEGTGYALELGVEAVPLAPSRIRQMRTPRESAAPNRGPAGTQGGAEGRGGGGFGRRNAATTAPIPDQDVAEVSQNWPEGQLEIRMGNYMLQAHQKWTIAPVPDVGGYLGAPYFRITIAGTDRTLAATRDAELVVVPAFTGEPEQLWRIDQLTDGTYRITPKSIPSYALTAVGMTTPSLTSFDPDNDRGRWNLRTP